MGLKVNFNLQPYNVNLSIHSFCNLSSSFDFTILITIPNLHIALYVPGTVSGVE